MDSSSVAEIQHTVLEKPVEYIDARVVVQSHGNTYNVYAGGNMEINNGAQIATSSQSAPPAKEELPPLPRCPAPCTGYVRRRVLEDHMSSYFSGTNHGGYRRRCYVLHGLGGSGKTQGALNFIDQNFYSQEPEQRRFSEAYWVDATSVETIVKSLEDIARSAGGSKAEDALALLASHNAQSNWILLYNNADDPSLDLTKHFPKCTHGNIIVTTRNCQAARYGLGSGSDYSVSGMEHDEAQELFTNQARLFDTGSATIQIVKQLIKELNYFPLSVRQAGSYIFATSCTPAEYLDKFRTRRKQLLRKHDEMNAEDYQYGTVEATLSLSFAKLDPDAQHLLQLFACLHREFILEKIFRDGFSGLRRYKKIYRRLATADEKITIASMNQFRDKLISDGRWNADKFRGLLVKLKSFSLATSLPEQEIYSIHPLVQEWTRSAMNKTRQTLSWRSATLLLGSAITMNVADTMEQLSLLRGLAPHVDEVMKRGVFNGCKNEFGHVYRSAGRWNDEFGLRGEYNEACKRVLGQQHNKTLTSLNVLALAYQDQGEYDKAAEIHSEVLEIRKVKPGVDHPETLGSMNNLALVYNEQGKYAKAAEIHSEVLEIRKVKPGVDHPETLGSVNNLALVYNNQGKYAKAAEMHSEVLEIYKVKLGVDHLDTLGLMNNLASVYYYQGQYDKAAEIHSEVLEIRKVKLGVDHPETLISMNNLALVYNKQGKYAKAAEIHSEVLEIRKVKLGVDHPETLISMNNLALVYNNQGRYDKAAEIHSEVLEIRKVKLGVDHPETLGSVNNLALVYNNQDKYDKAAEMHSEVLEIWKVKLGLDHPKTLISINNLAFAYWCLKDFDKAIELLSQLTELNKARFGIDHSKTQESIRFLENVLAEQRHFTSGHLCMDNTHYQQSDLAEYSNPTQSNSHINPSPESSIPTETSKRKRASDVPAHSKRICGDISVDNIISYSNASSEPRPSSSHLLRRGQKGR